MSFHHPELLWLLALPVFWGFWQWVRRGHPVVLPFDHGQQRSGKALRFFTNLAGTLPALLLAIAVLMLAGPRKTAPPQDERIMNNIILCIDVSGSMGARFGKGTRFEAAVDAAREFCNYRKGDAFGLTIFGSEFIHWVPPTKEMSAISSAMNYVRPDNMPPWMGGTLIANALHGCREELERTEQGDRAVVLITDGGSGDFANGGDRRIAEELSAANVRVFGIQVGNDGIGGGGMETIAGTTGGKVFNVDDRSALDNVFREIDRMQKARFKQVTADWVDDYTPLAIAGLVTAALYVLSLLGLRYTPW
ncbi:BatA and WFA domain-containing protein [Luteolibacter ambystomatis]|uniref:BatA and WFA domain-containing protein n=1 Tax=Luteolibacter ambystomatis TaxID=2824561 RepID=A0A975J2B3_9BACT|nr:BatA and WFA domain-containing protein [Luteolibacter ambystomatis]QUE52738.1 BatA and WFA domain-containing protein [Luteolibacter ambystomatis]